MGARASTMATLGASLLRIYSVFDSVSELRRACFRQERVARAVLPPAALFRAMAFALPICAPKSHLSLGHDMGGAKGMGEENVPDNTPSRKQKSDPSKRACGVLNLGILQKQSNNT